MIVNKARVNEILHAASADDPAVRLMNLERDVDLVRISIKRILMDIRERMNEMENPLVIVSPSRAPPSLPRNPLARKMFEESRRLSYPALTTHRAVIAHPKGTN